MAILRRYLIDNLAVWTLCEEQGVHPAGVFGPVNIAIGMTAAHTIVLPASARERRDGDTRFGP